MNKKTNNKKIYVTFGQAHIHKVNDKILDKDHVAIVTGNSSLEIKEKINKYFGDKYFTIHYENSWKEENMKYYPKGYVTIN